MSKQSAIDLVNRFAAQPSAGVWPNVNQTALASGLVNRINDPNLIDQGGTPLCGPASLVRSLALDNPDAYAQVAIDLYNRGAATLGSLRVAAGAQVRQASRPVSTPDADWLILSSIRDSENWFFSVGGLLGNSLAGITTAGALQRWLSQTGYTNIREAVHYAAKPLASVLCLEAQTASRLVGEGFRVMLLIDSDMLYTSNQGDMVSMYPDHWITLTSAISGIEGVDYNVPVSFSAYTWGGRRSVPENSSSPLSKRNFLHKYYGYVAARF